MSAEEHLGRQFVDELTMHYDPNTSYHHVYASHPEHPGVGGITWSEGLKHGEIENIEVEEKYRRRGVATALYRHAQHLAKTVPGVPMPKHSTLRSDEGEEWAQSLGEKLPERIDWSRMNRR